MQRADMSAAKGQDITAMTLKSLRNNASFDLYCNCCSYES